MIGVKSAFAWLGQKVSDEVFGEIDNRLTRAGYAWQARAEQLAPVKTGALRSSLYFRVADRTLTVGVGVGYGIFQEFGTRNIRPHPYIRPALNELGWLFGAELGMEFAAPGMGTWQGIYAHQGSFVVPSGIQPRPLTRAQHEHVRKHLMPTSKRLHKGNVKKAKMTVRRFD